MEEIVLVLFGLVFGSFLNVVIYRLPRGESLVRPGSHCPSCGKAIHWYDNVPVLGFILLGGRCRACRAPISPRYPLVEAFTALSFFLVGRAFPGQDLYQAAAILFVCLLISLALIDLEHMILPDELTLGGSLVFLAYSFFHPRLTTFEAIASGLGVAALFSALYYFYLKVRKIEGLGFGDVKMVLMLGLFLGPRQTLTAVLLASVSGLLTGLVLIVWQKKNLKLALPFGTFLAIGAYASLFWGERILHWLQTPFILP
ncbi:MAG TPA: prepilin peptidase [Candidatus Aminicenantes bacterium]|nr:prepilin peptidase [Candidatus Aminicenantes bacterium]